MTDRQDITYAEASGRASCRRCAHTLATAIAALVLCAQIPTAGIMAQELTPEAPISVARLESRIEQLNAELGVAFWLAEQVPGRDAETLADYADGQFQSLFAEGIAAIRSQGMPAEAEARRKLMLLEHRPQHPLPAAARERAQLTHALRRLSREHRMLTHCEPDGPCLDRIAMEQRLRTAGTAAERFAVWLDWQGTRKNLGPAYEQAAALLNDAARAWGYADLGAWWRARHELTDAELAATIERLWREIRPLYGALHCHVRRHFESRYGNAALPEGGALPAHLVGDLAARDWQALFPLLAEALPPRPDLDAAVRARFTSVEEMAHVAAAFYGTIGYPPLPESFWQRSDFHDREGCNRSGWNVDWRRDVRVSMCGGVSAGNFVWLHWILAHLHYDLAFAGRDWTYRDPPHLGFHRAHAGVMVASLTPAYLAGLGIFETMPGEKAELSRLLDEALSTLPELGLGYVAHRWRSELLAGDPRASAYNERWWALRERIQGIRAAVVDPEGFGPADAPDVIDNTDTLPAFLGTVMRYQLLAAACEAMQVTAPLHQCSIAGSKEVGARFQAMLELGSSRPWPEVLETVTGDGELSVQPLLEYYAPLAAWLAARNEGRSCGWPD